MNHTIPEIAEYIIKKCSKNKNIAAAEVFAVENNNTTVRTRLTKTETLESSGSTDIGIRVITGRKGKLKQAIVSSSSLQKQVLDKSLEYALDMVSVATEDPYLQVVERNSQAGKLQNVDIFDKSDPEPKELIKKCAAAEEAALAVKGVTNSEGAQFGTSHSSIYLFSTSGFVGSYKSSSFTLSLPVIAGKGDKMETDYEYTVARYYKDLLDAKELGKLAAEKAIGRLNPRKVKTCKVPIIFEKRMAREIVDVVSSAVNGAAIARKTSFLKDKLGKQIFPKNINIIDDPKVKRGLHSRPFDGEGFDSQKLDIIKDGVLNSLLLDTKTAAQLKMKSNGRASRGVSSPPSPSYSNIYMENGRQSLKQLLSSVKSGFYVTDAFGMGINLVSGDYSQGAAGFWIENGKISYPVSEVTIAGNLADMFMNITPANDLEMIYAINSPSLLIEGMTIAGT